jgi:Holliday junction resolvase
MVKRYAKGRRLEYMVIESLKRDGWYTVRSAGSKGIADIVALKPSKVALVQCSVGKKPFKQVKPLLDLCRTLNVTPCLAVKGSKIPIILFWGEGAILRIYKGLKRV